ncbi:RagB/SusD family nutrient uptake outer membrane protein [Bacteroides fragilis]|nr:RagB/SusD family nutrient uptake outer membrane protein [Bacteroides fragilis]
MLTYAEARIQIRDGITEVQKALNDLRDRCGMPDVPTTMPSKKSSGFVRNERRIELAAEGHQRLMIYGVMVASAVVRL